MPPWSKHVVGKIAESEVPSKPIQKHGDVNEFQHNCMVTTDLQKSTKLVPLNFQWKKIGLLVLTIFMPSCPIGVQMCDNRVAGVLGLQSRSLD